MLTNIIEIVILSLVQGVSEFLPISSSAHLIVVSTLYEFKSNISINRCKFTPWVFIGNHIFF